MSFMLGMLASEGASGVLHTTDIETFRSRARAWLAANAEPLPPEADPVWGRGSDTIAVFHDLSLEAEGALLDELMAWQRAKYDAGFGAIAWPVEHGGAGLSPAHQLAFEEEEAAFVTPRSHETFSVTFNLVAPTILAFGTDEQKRELLPRFVRTTELCCQLFSEPGAGSDLAGLGCRAVRDGDGWVVNGQKTWSSGAKHAAWGELIARSDIDVPKHAGQTAFVVPMDLPGITIVPIRQMSGGASFNEVFFDEVRVPDSMRLGGVGDGWRVALTTLGFERGTSGSEKGSSTVGATWRQLRALAEWSGRTGEPGLRQRLASLYSLHRVRDFYAQRAHAHLQAGGAPGPEGSISKLLWVQWLSGAAEAAASILGPRLAADTGEWGTYAWNGQVLGAPGYHIAGGSDEIQRNIIGERVLGLPAEPRVDRGMPFKEVPR